MQLHLSVRTRLVAWAIVVVACAALPATVLAQSDDARRAATRAIGVIVMTSSDVARCPAVLVAANQLLTSAQCARGDSTIAVFGGSGSEKKTFLRMPEKRPLELDERHSFAVVEVPDEFGKEFGVARFSARKPIRGEKALFVAFDGTTRYSIDNCVVTGTAPSSNSREFWVDYVCGDSPIPRMGVLVAEADNEVLGFRWGESNSTANDRTKAAFSLVQYSSLLARAVAAQASAVKPLTLDFEVANSQSKRVGDEITNLYLTLYNSRRLPIAAYEIGAFSTIENLFRERGLFYGNPFPVQLDSLACDLNIHVCTRRLEAAAVKTLQFVDHVSGYIPSRGQWEVDPGTQIYLPAMHLERTRNWVAYSKRKGAQVASIVVKELGGCDDWDNACRQLIVGVNRGQEALLSDDYQGVLLLPTLSVVAKDVDISLGSLIKSPSKELSNTSRSVTVAPGKEGKGLVLETGENTEHFKVITQPREAPFFQKHVPSDLDSVLRELKTSASGNVSIQSHAAGEPDCKGTLEINCELKLEDFQLYQSKVRVPLNFPYTDRNSFPLLMQQGHSAIGIIDGPVDTEHCGLAGLRTTGRLVSMPNSTLPAKADLIPGEAPCKWLQTSDRLSKLNSHGSHVAGIVAGGADRFWALNPFARMFVGTLPVAQDGAALVVKTRALSALITKLIEEAANTGRGMDVVNLSFEYRRSADFEALKGDPVLTTISELGRNTLFVVAAGNDGEELSAICDKRPACFDLPNVISGAAFDQWKEGMPLLEQKDGASNFGRRVHVAAPGREVLSLAANNYFGVMSGTSQAAPQVAAIAAMMRAAKPNLTPADVKERLVTCSIPIKAGAASLTRNPLYGGRVDTRCALSEEGLLELKSRQQFQVRKIRTDGAGVNPYLEFRPTGQSYTVDIRPGLVRGLQFDASDDSYTVFYRKTSLADPESPLIKEVELGVTDPLTLRLEVKTPEMASFEPRTFRISEISRFVAPLPQR